MDELTDREYAEVLGSLQIVSAMVKAEGREPTDINSALKKLMKGCGPSTTGLKFELLDSGS